MLYPAMKRWLPALAAALLACLILDGGFFLTIPVLGSPGLPGIFLWIAVLTFLFAVSWPGVPAKDAFLFSGFGALYALMTLLGLRYSRNEAIYQSAADFLVPLAALTLLYTSALALFLRFFGVIQNEPGNRPGGAGSGVRPAIRRWCFWMALTLCVYLPVFLALYPGVYSYDASAQIGQFFGVIPVSTHHPLIHTLYLCACLKAGGVLFGSYQAGMALYSLSQACIVSAAFSLLLVRMGRRGAPRWLQAVSWLFLVVNPYVTVFSFVTTKDVLFGVFFLLAFDAACDLAADPARMLSDWRELLLFFGSALLLCLFRNQGVYVFLFFALFTALFLWKKERRRCGRFVAMSAAVCVLWYGLAVFLPVLWGAQKGDMREMLSVPMQQLARVYAEAPEELTEEEKEYLEELIDPEALASYIRVNADPVKSGFHTEVLKENPARFLEVWGGIGLRLPGVYLDSFLMGNWGYWYPGDSQYWISYLLFDGAYLEAPYNVLGIAADSRLPQLRELLGNLTRTPEFQKIPVLSILFNQAFPLWLALFVSAALIRERRLRLLLPLLLVYGYWGTLLLGPVTSLRYALPLIYCVPRIFAYLSPRSGSARGRRFIYCG